MTNHQFRATCSWSGTTGVGFDDYDRAHTGGAPPAATVLPLTAAPGYRGDPELLNPEQLVALAAASCQLLSFLAAAARARIDVRRYDDDAEAVMPDDDRPVRITRIVLRPRIEVVEGPTEDEVRRLCEVAHRACFVANSLRSEISVEPQVVFVPT